MSEPINNALDLRRRLMRRAQAGPVTAATRPEWMDAPLPEAVLQGIPLTVADLLSPKTSLRNLTGVDNDDTLEWTIIGSTGVAQASSAQQKQFRGWVALQGFSEREFVGFTTYGPAAAPHRGLTQVATGRDLDHVIDAVNARVGKKLAGEYRMLGSRSTWESMLSSAAILQEARGLRI